MKFKEVYVVFREEQDNTIILGVFTKSEKAEKYAKKKDAYVEPTLMMWIGANMSKNEYRINKTLLQIGLIVVSLIASGITIAIVYDWLTR